MNPEDRLSQALHQSLDHRQPSPNLADRIVEGVAQTRSRRIASRLRLVLSGAAAILILAVASAVPLALLQGADGGHSSSPAAAPTEVPTAAETPSPASDGHVHYSHAGLTFDYPEAWQPSGQELNMHYVTIFGYVGTGTGSDYCTNFTPGPSDNWTGMTECGGHENVGPGQVLVEIAMQDGPPGPGPLDPADESRLQAGESYVTVAGVPTIYSETREGDKLTLGWTISMPGQIYGVYLITATIRDPGTEAMRAQVQQLIAGAGFDPPVPALNPADGPRIAAAAVAKEKADGQILDCFPADPGASASAIVTQLPNYGQPLTKPLPAGCTTAIEPTPIGLWRLTLTLSWTAAADRSAGSARTVFWLHPDGTPGTMTGFGDIPYQP
jgi:hypothetical protein